MCVVTQHGQRPLQRLVAADNLLQRPGQLSDGLKIADIQIVHPGPPGGGVVADILLGQLALDFRAVGVTVFHAAGKVKYPGIHRRQFNQFIALFYKIALQAVTGKKLWNNQFVVIGRCKHLVKGWPYLVTQIEVGRKNAQRPRFQALVNPLVDRQFAQFFLC